MKLFVTGATGFSGGHVVAALAAAGHDITAHCGRSANPRYVIPRGVATISGHLLDLPALPKGTEAVIHAAAQSPPPGGGPIGVEDFIHSNALATAHLARLAERVGVRRFLYFSSISINGRIDVPVLTETSPIQDPDIYGITKRLGEIALTEHGFASLSMRLPGVVGKGAVRNWLSSMLDAAQRGADIPFFNGDALYNNAVHIGDLSAFIAALLHREWEGHDIVVLGATEPITVRRMVETFAAAGKGSRLIELPSGKPPFLIGHDRAIADYGYCPMAMSEMLTHFLVESGVTYSG